MRMERLSDAHGMFVRSAWNVCPKRMECLSEAHGMFVRSAWNVCPKRMEFEKGKWVKTGRNFSGFEW